MKKILPFEINIPIKTYNYIAFSLSILYGNYDNADDWLFINGFNLKYGTGASDVTLNLPSNMNWECFDKKLLNNVDINNDDIIKEINEGRYVYLAVDEKFVPNRANYMIKSFVHDILVYGYDLNTGVFYTAGYNCLLNYECQQIKFCVFEKAMNSAKTFLLNETSNYEFFGSQNYFSLKPIFINNIVVDEISFCLLLDAYLKGSINYESELCTCYTGNLIYNKIVEDLRALEDNRNWHIINEQKNFISAYIKNKFPSYIDDVEVLEKYAKICLNLSIKYKINKSLKTLYDLKTKIKEMCIYEKVLFEKLYYISNY